MDADEKWMKDSNEALEFSLVLPGANGPKTVAKFHPGFTYSIFGDSEKIFGYQDLKISLAYNATDMRPNLAIHYSKKFKPVGETEALEVPEVLKQYLPEIAFQKKAEFDDAVAAVAASWTPPGHLVSSFEIKQGATRSAYEVWKGSLEDPAVKQMMNRIQIFVPCFIEGGTLIEDQGDGDRWTVFFLYERQTITDQQDPTYIFAGYSTVYRFFLYNKHKQPTTVSEDIDLSADFDLAELPCRTRISQFIILPPFQGKGLGSLFYSTLFNEYLNHPQTVEITVEDPNEAFDDLRDVTDLKYLRQIPEFTAITLNAAAKVKDGIVPNDIIDAEATEELRRKVKIAPRQFARVLEMHLMSKLPDPVRPNFTVEKPLAKATKEQQRELELWRLLVKARVYRRNKDALGQLVLGERIAKLEETVLAVEFDYARLLSKADARSSNESSVTGGKRKLAEAGLEGGVTASKKARAEDA
ncbi:histone acetyltransferase type B [Thozetella sp. PMI_491]|nr:histone acetyltransferase type B [Thozetella sp. PMI_491]